MESKAFCNDFTMSNGVHTVTMTGANGNVSGAREAGVTLIELVVAIVLMELAFLAIADSMRTSLIHFKRSLRETYATELAIEKMEELAAKDPLAISSDGERENITVRSVKFVRSVEVTVRPDKSRLVTVSVTPEQTELGGKCILSNTFPAREETTE